MNLYMCKEKKRANNNSIVSYILVNQFDGTVLEIDTNQLKNSIKNHSLEVLNLTLTADNKLVDKHIKEDGIIQKYIDSCEVLGIKPLTIIKYNGKYVITDIPQNTKNIQIPSFVSAIALKKTIGTPQIINYTNNNNTNNQDLVETLSNISRKLDIIEDNTTEIYNKQHENSALSIEKINEMKSSLNNLLDGVTNVTSEVELLKSMINNTTPELIETSSRMLQITSDLADRMLDIDASTLEDSQITSLSNLPSDSLVLGKNKNCMCSRDKYLSFNQRYPMTYVAYRDVNKIIPYLKYCELVYTEVYNALALGLDISGETPEVTKKRIEHASNWLGYLLTGFLMFAYLPGGAAGLAAIAAIEPAKDVLKSGSSLLVEAYEIDKIKSTDKKTKIAFKKYCDNVPELVDEINCLNNYMDRHIYIFALENTVVNTKESLNVLNKDGFYDRIILKVLMRLRDLKAVKYSDIELRIKVSYLAACMYVDEKYKFNNDMSKEEVMALIGKKVKYKQAKGRVEYNTLTYEQKRAYARQRKYYGFMIKWFRVALYHCNISQVFVDKIIAMFEIEAKAFCLTVENVDDDIFNSSGRSFDMERYIIQSIDTYDNR